MHLKGQPLIRFPGNRWKNNQFAENARECLVICAITGLTHMDITLTLPLAVLRPVPLLTLQDISAPAPKTQDLLKCHISFPKLPQSYGSPRHSGAVLSVLVWKRDGSWRPKWKRYSWIPRCRLKRTVAVTFWCHSCHSCTSWISYLSNTHKYCQTL